MRMSALVLLTCLLVFSDCKRRSSNSKLRTTSDMLTEFRYEVQGKITVPLDRQNVRRIYDFDELARLVDKSSSESLVSLLPVFATDDEEAKRDTGFEELYGAGFPVSNQNIGIWIEQQLKYTLQSSLKQGLSISLADVPQAREVSRTNTHVTFDYTAIIRLAQSATNIADNVRSLKGDALPLADGAVFKVPQDPLSSYELVMGPDYTKALNDFNRGILNPSNLRSSVDLLQSTRKNAETTADAARQARDRCLAYDGDVIYPFNLFFYLKSDDPACAVGGMTTLTLSKGALSRPRETYPEYHLLFADKRVTAAMYFGIMNASEKSYGYHLEVAEELLGQGYKINEARVVNEDHTESTLLNPTPQSLRAFYPVEIKMSRQIGDINFDVALVAEIGLKYINQDDANNLLRKYFRESEIIVFDGHAGYGRSSSLYNDPSVFPSRTYQIVFLNACWSYKYALSTVLSAKAIRDLDFKDSFIDVLTTFAPARGYEHDSVLMRKLGEAALAYGANDRSKLKTDSNWLQIVTAMNNVQRSAGGIYAVSGEEHNLFSPDIPNYSSITVPQATEEEILKFLAKTDRKEIAIAGVETILMKRLTAAGGDLDKFMSQASEICRRVPLVSKTELFTKECVLGGMEINLSLQVPLDSVPPVTLELEPGSSIKMKYNKPHLRGQLAKRTPTIQAYKAISGQFEIAKGSYLIFDRKSRLEKFTAEGPDGSYLNADLSFGLAPISRPSDPVAVRVVPKNINARPKMQTAEQNGAPLAMPAGEYFSDENELRSGAIEMHYDPFSITVSSPDFLALSPIVGLATNASITGKIHAAQNPGGAGFARVTGQPTPNTQLSAIAGAAITIPELNNWSLPEHSSYRVQGRSLVLDVNASFKFARRGLNRPIRISQIIFNDQGQVKMLLCKGGFITATEDTCEDSTEEVESYPAYGPAAPA